MLNFGPHEVDLFHIDGSKVRVTSEIFNNGQTFETPYGVVLNADILCVASNPNVEDEARYTVLPRGELYLVDFQQQGSQYAMFIQDTDRLYWPTQSPAKWDARSFDAYYYGYLIHPSPTTWGGPWRIQADMTPRPTTLKCQRKAARAWRTIPKVQQA